MSKVIVYHASYGCETGCCGHVVEVDPGTGLYSDIKENFDFDHPGYGEDPRQFAERLVEQVFGPEHVKDLDWDNCVISDY